MIELNRDTLNFRFPEVHPEASLTLTLHRTLRLPEDDRTYPLPPGLGAFPLRHIDDFKDRLPERMVAKGGVLVPMYQSEALWIEFSSQYLAAHIAAYPFAVQIATGKVNAVSGQPWRDELSGAPQSYVVAPTQPWLDGFNVGKGLIRQFVAMPLGSGFTAEEQVTGHAAHGGLQISVTPMRRDEFERRFPKRFEQVEVLYKGMDFLCESAELGLAPGGRMRQEIATDPYGLGCWDLRQRRRCFVHLVDSMAWRQITGEKPPQPPLTAAEYAHQGLPWFDYYDQEIKALTGSPTLSSLKPTSRIASDKQVLRPFMPTSAPIATLMTIGPKGEVVVREELY